MRRLDPRALGQYLALNYTLSDACLLAGVRKLPPVHLLLLERGRPEVLRRYWDLAPQFRNKSRHPSEAAAAGALGALIVDSVRLRMIADVPVGAFLSGGRKDRARAVTMEGPLCDWVDPRAVERVSTEDLARRRDNGLKLFALACLGLWLDELVAAPPIAGDMPAAGVA